MASIKILLWSKPNKEGLFPIAIRIIKDRKPSYIYIGHYIQKSQWDAKNARVKKSHPNSARLNNLIAKKISEASDNLLDLESQKKDVSSTRIKAAITSTKGTGFNAQADFYLTTLEQSGKFNRYSADKPRINRFKTFLGGHDIAFEEITIPLLEKFQAFLRGTFKISERTVVNHLVVMRSIFSQAIKADVVDAKYYPFGKGKIKIKFPESSKIGLTESELKQLEVLDLTSNERLNNARNIWLFSFYFAGMRISDVLRLRWSDFQNDRLHYSMGKNNKGGSLKIPQKAVNILKHYDGDKENNSAFVFRELRGQENLKDAFTMQKKIATANKALNIALRDVAKLAGIDKQLTMHIARHTFGNLSGDRIPIQMLQKLYRHSSVTTTIGYQSNFIHKDADDALDAVIGG